MRKRTLCIWLPEWPLQRIRAARPELRGQPLVLHGPHRGLEQVVRCSAQAKALGVMVGMPLAEAVALVGMSGEDPGENSAAGMPDSGTAGWATIPRVSPSAEKNGPPAAARRSRAARAPMGFRHAAAPSPCKAHHPPPGETSLAVAPPTAPARVLPYDPTADRRALEALAEWCGRFSPLAAVEESPAPEALCLDITGITHLFGGELRLAETIIGAFTRRRLAARVAVADTLGAAWAVARYAGPAAAASAAFTVHRGPLTIVSPHRTLPALRPLPIEALRLPEEVTGPLHQLGIDRIGQLEALPRGELRSRFGPGLLGRWDQAVGRLAEPVPARPPSPQLRSHWSPEYPTARRAAVEAALERLIARLAAMLVRLGRGAMRLECRLHGTWGEPVGVSLGLFRPTTSAGHLFQLAQMQLERLRLPGPVSAVEVEVSLTAPLEHRQGELFPDARGQGVRRADPRGLAALVDRLSSRLGPRSVFRPRLLPEAQPEVAWGDDPLVGERRRRGGRRRSPAGLPPRPLRLLPRPVPLHTTSAMPDGPPWHLQLGGRHHRVAESWGPERIETGWWRGRAVGRDYYRIETTAGRRFWLFRRLRDGRWFLHGTFE